MEYGRILNTTTSKVVVPSEVPEIYYWGPILYLGIYNVDTLAVRYSYTEYLKHWA